MARSVFVEVAGLNITVDPHSEEIYRHLFSTVFARKQIAQISKTDAAMISYLELIPDEAALVGVVSKFSKIDTSLDWFNDETLRPAEEADKNQIRIPDFLHPNLKPFNFIFDLKRHHMIFEVSHEGRRVTPRTIARIFNTFFTDIRILDEFGTAEVSIRSHEAALDQMLSMDEVRNVSVVIKKPNADVLDDDAAFMQRLQGMKAREHSQVWKAERGQSIELDADALKITKLGTSNGEVKVTARDEDGKIKTVSTEQFPATASEKYDPEITIPTIAFRKCVTKYLRKYNI